MKIACEKCNKIIDSYFKDEYENIKKPNDVIVLCKSTGWTRKHLTGRRKSLTGM